MTAQQKNRPIVQVAIRQIVYHIDIFGIRPNDIGPYVYTRVLLRINLGGWNGSVVEHQISNPKVPGSTSGPARPQEGNPGLIKPSIYRTQREGKLSKPVVVVSLWRVMWCRLTYRVAKSGRNENPPIKPRPNNGRRVASSDVWEYKIGIRGGDKVEGRKRCAYFRPKKEHPQMSKNNTVWLCSKRILLVLGRKSCTHFEPKLSQFVFSQKGRGCQIWYAYAIYLFVHGSFIRFIDRIVNGGLNRGITSWLQNYVTSRQFLYMGQQLKLFKNNE